MQTPGVIHLYHGSCSAVVGPEPMVIRVKEVISVHILYNLAENDSLNDFTDDAKDCYWPIVLWFKWICFL